MDAFQIDDVAARRRQTGESYLQFLSKGSLSVGLYELAAGSEDPQQPHAEDEVYYIVEGRATLRAGDEDRAVGPGAIVFVAANVPHQFHTIEENLSVLVFFAPEHTVIRDA